VSDDPDHDSQTFREAMRDVRRLRDTSKRAPPAPKPPPRARFTRADQQEVLRESLLPPSDEAMLATGDELSFRRPHIPESVLVKLRRGHYTVDAELDLHGMTGAEAKAVTKGSGPASGASKVQLLKGNEYIRVWVRQGDTHYLVHLAVPKT
jgi:DNA-nicking Smr family endonuclease